MRGAIIATVFHLSALILLAGCASHRVMLIHPQNGASAECSARGLGLAAVWVERTLEECTRRYEGQGYVRRDALTPEQEADLVTRGLLSR